MIPSLPGVKHGGGSVMVRAHVAENGPVRTDPNQDSLKAETVNIHQGSGQRPNMASSSVTR